MVNICGKTSYLKSRFVCLKATRRVKMKNIVNYKKPELSCQKSSVWLCSVPSQQNTILGLCPPKLSSITTCISALNITQTEATSCQVFCSQESINRDLQRNFLQPSMRDIFTVAWLTDVKVQLCCCIFNHHQLLHLTSTAQRDVQFSIWSHMTVLLWRIILEKKNKVAYPLTLGRLFKQRCNFSNPDHFSLIK